MGQQQLLLLLLGVFVTGIAIFVGIELFGAGSESSNLDSIINDITRIATMGQTYYLRPATMGGGQGSFDDYQIPERYKATGHGTYELDEETGGNVLSIRGESTIFPNITVKLTITYNEGSYTWDWDAPD